MGGKEKSVSIRSCLIPDVGTKWNKEASPKADFTPLLPRESNPVPQVWAEGWIYVNSSYGGLEDHFSSCQGRGGISRYGAGGFCLVSGFLLVVV